MKAKISVIIPFYAHKKWLNEALESVINQTYKNIEIIVINDGSTENIDELQVKYKDKVIFITQENKGVSVARNRGIELATGDYVAFLDSDDLWYPDKLFKQIEFMKKYDYVWSHTDYIRFDANHMGSQKRVVCNLYGNIMPKCLIWNPIATPCIIIKTTLLKENQHLRFKKNKSIGEDTGLWQEIGKNYKLGYLDEALTKVRIHGNNAAFQARLQLQARSELFNELVEYKKYFKSKIIYYFFRTMLFYCKVSSKIIVFVVKKIKMKKEIDEFVCKIVYIIPYINFKILKHFL